MSLSARRAWIEIAWAGAVLWSPAASLSARRAWIEIKLPAPEDQVATVALRKESVDRNTRSREAAQQVHVALRKESVDRNPCSAPLLNFDVVALRKESVDRNYCYDTSPAAARMSLSARRAWIEMLAPALRRELAARRSPQGERG